MDDLNWILALKIFVLVLVFEAVHGFFGSPLEKVGFAIRNWIFK